jgi:RNA polymerase sigma factor (sigma-70 family)
MNQEAWFEALYREHCGTVRAYVHRRVPPAAADDVVADVFVIAWRRLNDVAEDELPWLIGIARGVLANRRRVEARRIGLRDRLVTNAVAESDPQQECPLGESKVVRALTTLSQRDQELLLLVAWDGLDRTQAARALGISPSTFAVRLHRARRRLARAVADRQEAEERRADDTSAMEAL